MVLDIIDNGYDNGNGNESHDGTTRKKGNCVSLETYPRCSAFDWGRGRAATEEGEERVKEADGVVVMIYDILVIVAIKVAAFSCLRGCAGFQE